MALLFKGVDGELVGLFFFGGGGKLTLHPQSISGVEINQTIWKNLPVVFCCSGSMKISVYAYFLHNIS